MSDALEEVEKLADSYAEARGRMADLVAAIRAEQREVLLAHIEELRRLASETSTKRDVLDDALGEHKALFSGGKDSPRTRSIRGVKIGWRKKPGKLVWASAVEVVARIRQHLPRQAPALIQVTEAPVRAALKHLPVADLARIGVTLEADVDEVVIAPAKDDLDQIVAAFMDDGAAASGEEI